MLSSLLEIVIGLVLIFRGIWSECPFYFFSVCVMVVFRSRRSYIFVALVLATVGVAHRSRVVSREGLVGFRKDVILVNCLHVGWVRGMFRWYVFDCNRRVCV